MVFTFVNAGVIVLRLQTTLESLSIKLDPNDTTCNPLHQKQQHGNHHHLHHQRKAIARRKSNTLVYLLLLFVGSLLAASMLVSSSAADPSSSSSTWRVALCLLVAAVTSLSILNLPHTWSPPKTTATSPSLSDGDMNINDNVDSTASVHDHLTAKFQCPWVPMVPLGGIACNTFMMGSLPTSSWFLCLIWLGCGVGVYFVYGIHHSALGHKERYATDTIPLLPGGRSTYDGYESTLNVTMPEYHDHHHHHADRDPSYQQQQLIQ